MNKIIKDIIDIHLQLSAEYLKFYKDDQTYYDEITLKFIPNFETKQDYEKFSIYGGGISYESRKIYNKYSTKIYSKESDYCGYLTSYFGCNRNDSWIYKSTNSSVLAKDLMLVTPNKNIRIQDSDVELPYNLISKDEYFNLSLEHDIPSYELYHLGLKLSNDINSTVELLMNEKILELVKK
ncbi:hypothetical protein XaC1_124 [Xanthomonas phage XaC1]|nr:hypothetical protein XaC1_124 [Xanthomonas phage XaC1]